LQKGKEMNKEVFNLGDALGKEISRNQELLSQYAKVSTLPGVYTKFAEMMIKNDINMALTAVVQDDTAMMLEAYKRLAANE
jgi:hypothetical protein